MKKFMALTLAILLLLGMTVIPISAAETTLWTFDSGQGSWTGSSGLSFNTSTPGILAVNIAQADAYMMSNVSFASTYNKIKIRMKNATSSTDIQVFYGTSLAPGISGTRVKSFTGLSANMTEYKDVYLDMSSAAAWLGTITSLRLDIANSASSGTVYIDSIELIKSSTVQWDFTDSAQGWAINAHGTYDAVVAGNLGINITGADASIQKSGTDIDSRYNKIKIRLKNETSSTAFEVYFTTNVVPGMSSATRKAFVAATNMTDYQDVIIDMRDIPNWANFITTLRIDTANSALAVGSKVYIDSIQLMFDTTALQTKITTAQSLNESDYGYGWANLQSAMSAGQTLLSSPNLTAAESDNAVAAIDNAIAGLIPISLFPVNKEYVDVVSENFDTALTAPKIASDWIIPFPSNAYMFAGDSLAKVSWTGGTAISGTGSVLATAGSYQNYKLETNIKVGTYGVSSTLSLRNAPSSIKYLRDADSTLRPGTEGIMIVLGGTSIATNEFAIVFKNGQLITSDLLEKSEHKIKYPTGVSITGNTNITIYDLDDKIYINMGGIPVARIELTGLAGDSYTSGSVYNVKNELVGTSFSNMVIKREGHVGYSVRAGSIDINDVTISQVLNQTQTIATDNFDKTAWGTGNSQGNKAKIDFIAGEGYTVTLSVKVDKSLGRSTIALKDKDGVIVDSKNVDCFFVTSSWVDVTFTVPSKGKYTLEITAAGSNYSEIANVEFVEGLGATTAGNSIVFDGATINAGRI